MNKFAATARSTYLRYLFDRDNIVDTRGRSRPGQEAFKYGLLAELEKYGQSETDACWALDAKSWGGGNMHYVFAYVFGMLLNKHAEFGIHLQPDMSQEDLDELSGEHRLRTVYILTADEPNVRSMLNILAAYTFTYTHEITAEMIGISQDFHNYNGLTNGATYIQQAIHTCLPDLEALILALLDHVTDLLAAFPGSEDRGRESLARVLAMPYNPEAAEADQRICIMTIPATVGTRVISMCINPARVIELLDAVVVFICEAIHRFSADYDVTQLSTMLHSAQEKEKEEDTVRVEDLLQIQEIVKQTLEQAVITIQPASNTGTIHIPSSAETMPILNPEITPAGTVTLSTRDRAVSAPLAANATQARTAMMEVLGAYDINTMPSMEVVETSAPVTPTGTAQMLVETVHQTAPAAPEMTVNRLPSSDSMEIVLGGADVDPIQHPLDRTEETRSQIIDSLHVSEEHIQQAEEDLGYDTDDDEEPDEDEPDEDPDEETDVRMRTEPETIELTPVHREVETITLGGR